MSRFPRVEAVRARVGPDALLLAWPLGSKGARRKWGHITLADTQAAPYLRQLEKGNIGVALGSKSGGLCSVDWDSDERLAGFLALNPGLLGALRTRGARGGNVWVRCTGAFPPSRKLMVAGEEVGEWRADGNQTIVSGRHPSGSEYTFLVDGKPAAVEFQAIVWPDDVKPPRLEAIEHSYSDNSENTGVLNDNSGVLKRTQVGADSPLFDLTPFFCTRRHLTDFKLWSMARRVRSWERDNGRKAIEAEALVLFDEWWKHSKAFVDPGEEYFDYLSKWKRSFKTAKLPIDACSLETAWKLTLGEPLPNEALLTYGPEPLPRLMQLVIALCFHLQQLSGDKPFFLGSRDAARLLGIPEGKHTRVFNWLELFSDPEGRFKLLTKVSSGSQVARKTNEWRYHASDRKAPPPLPYDPDKF